MPLNVIRMGDEWIENVFSLVIEEFDFKVLKKVGLRKAWVKILSRNFWSEIVRIEMSEICPGRKNEDKSQ